MEGGGEGFPEIEKEKKQSGRVAMEGGGEGFPEIEKEKEKENIFVSISRKIGEAYAWLKDKLISLFKLFSESIAKALLGLKSFVTSCCEKLREVLSGINAQLDDHFGKKKVVVLEEEEEASLLVEMKMGVVPEKEKEKASLLVEMKILVEKMTSWVNQYSGIGFNSLEMKDAHLELKRSLYLSKGFIKLLEWAYEKPLPLILLIVDRFFTYRSNKKTGWVMKAAGHEGEAAMAIDTLMSLILPPTVLV